MEERQEVQHNYYAHRLELSLEHLDVHVRIAHRRTDVPRWIVEVKPSYQPAELFSIPFSSSVLDSRALT